MPYYVIQKHAASRLHYDFRLEVGGVLRSWAIPKGPSTNPRSKRLAVPVEDHSLDWGDYEGVIESGYGAGVVIVWDRGQYTNLTQRDGKPVDMEEALSDGHVRLRIEGAKLKGEYTMNRLADSNWLLIKAADAHADLADDVLKRRPESVLTGRTIEDYRTRPARRSA